MNVNIQIVGVDAVGKKFSELQKQSLDVVQKAVTREAINLVRYVKEQKLTGQSLQVQTGRLRRSVTAKFEGEGTDTFTAIVGTNVKYGRFWELGFDRKVGAGARGGPRSLHGSALGKYMAKHPPAMKHIKARPFLKPSFEENLPRIKDNLAKAVKKALSWN